MSTSPIRDNEGNRLPPPPPPPPPEDPRSKISPVVRKLRSAPPGHFYQAPRPPPPAVDLLATPTGPYFFYGTLTDPSMIADILDLKEEPAFRPASVLGYRCKLWGQYPALLDAPGSMVEGAAYHVRTPEDGEKLAAYETSSYRAEPCLITYTDGKEPATALGYTFKFAGHMKDLSEGDFNLQVWRKRMGRHAAADKVDAPKGG